MPGLGKTQRPRIIRSTPLFDNFQANDERRPILDKAKIQEHSPRTFDAGITTAV